MSSTKKLQPVRGTHDILPQEARLRRHIAQQLFAIAQRYGFSEIQTPIFEFSEVFHRTLGDTSDVVSKETYCFDDRGGESLTLRPELTASIVRAFISNGLQQTLPCRFAYYGPAFRYERPQKGRMRQFHQLGIEYIGANGALDDVETIALAWDFLGTLKLQAEVSLQLNTLGDSESRAAYRNALVNYFTQHQSQLSEESKHRLKHNPLRILDSKDEGDRHLIANAPQMEEYYTPETQDFYQKVKAGLELLDIPYQHNPHLVRGLDYYCHSVFEFTCDRLGAQSTLLAGGRYDRLVEMMGGNPTPAVGWAAGMERLLLASTFTPPAAERPFMLLPMGEDAEQYCLRIAHQLRKQGKTTLTETRGNIGKRLKRASAAHAQAALIIGEDEMKSEEIQVKWLDSGEQESIRLSQLLSKI